MRTIETCYRHLNAPRSEVAAHPSGREYWCLGYYTIDEGKPCTDQGIILDGTWPETPIPIMTLDGLIDSLRVISDIADSLAKGLREKALEADQAARVARSIANTLEGSTRHVPK